MKAGFILMLPIILAGCLSPGGRDDSHSRGVKLSEAMDSSAKGDQRDLGGSRYRSSDTGGEVHVHEGGGGRSDFAAVSYDEGEYFWQVLAEVGYTRPSNGDIEDMTHVTLMPVALEEERHFLAWTLRVASVEYEDGSLPDVSTRDPWTLDTGLVYRFYLNHPQTGLSPYLTGGASIGVMGWKYRSPIMAGGEIIDSDRLNLVSGYVGVGITTHRNSRFSLFGEVDLGGTLFWNETLEGFENDVFDDFGFVTVRAGLSIKF